MTERNKKKDSDGQRLRDREKGRKRVTETERVEMKLHPVRPIFK